MNIFKYLLIIVLFIAVSCKETNNVSSYGHEFSDRYQMSYDRLTQSSHIPEFSDDFILADVELDPLKPRRFSEYSGDLSGRYIEVLSLTAQDQEVERLHMLIERILSNQQEDGRFGDLSLNFQQENISGEHMALLWGNGRMLVGLLTYYDRFKNPDVLDAAKKISDFYLTTYEFTATPETIDKLEGFGAQGIICFTQFIEGLTRLTEITGDGKYLDIAHKVYPLLPDRGIQHSHGYLTTLRGVLNMYEYTGENRYIDYVTSRYADLVHSRDYTIFGAVMEYFGGKGLRDEGCSTADFVRLSLQLYHVTGDVEYLARGEYGLFNALYFNQYETGDFGHHILVSNKSRLYDDEGISVNIRPITGSSSHFRMAAWWCCTMHGLRALCQVKDQAIKVVDNNIFIDLYAESDVNLSEGSIMIQRIIDNGPELSFLIDLKTVGNHTLHLRIPEWADDYSILIDENPVLEKDIHGHYISLGSLSGDENIQLKFDLKTALIEDISEVFDPSLRDSSPDNAYILYGPYLMCIEDNMEPEYSSEPNNNKLLISNLKPIISTNNLYQDMILESWYTHDGFTGKQLVRLRPVKDLAFMKRPMSFIHFNLNHEAP